MRDVVFVANMYSFFKMLSYDRSFVSKLQKMFLVTSVGSRWTRLNDLTEYANKKREFWKKLESQKTIGLQQPVAT